MEASPVPGMPTRERIASPVPGLPTGERIAGIVPEEEISGKGKERIPLLPALTVDWVLFLLCWPFGALVSALRRLGMPEAKTVIFFFCLYFGFVFIYGDPYRDRTTDSARYAMQLIEMHAHPVTLPQLFSLLYKPKTDLLDVYQPLATWLVSLFTADPRFLFALYGAVFGLFWAQNIWLLFTRIGPPLGLTILLFLGAFALINPVWNINGVRMWTAAQIFIYGVLLWFLDGKRSGLLWSSLSLLVHFSFAFPVVLFLMYLLVPGNLFLLLLFFLGSSLVKEIDLQSVREALDYLPDIFKARLEGYTSENYARDLAKEVMDMPMYVQVSEWVAGAVVYLWVIALYLTRRQWEPGEPALRRFFGFTLFLGGFVQIVSLIPSGPRFIIISHSLFYVAFILVIARMPGKPSLSLLKNISIPLLVFYILYNVRMGFDFMGILTFLGNPLLAFLSSEQLPLIEFVKSLL